MLVVRERVIEPELLDHAPPEDARANLEDLVRINRYFGAYGILRGMMRGLADPAERFSLLDVGSASGDMGAALSRTHPRATVTALDRREVHLDAAPHPKLVGDAFRLPFGRRASISYSVRYSCITFQTTRWWNSSDILSSSRAERF